MSCIDGKAHDFSFQDGRFICTKKDANGQACDHVAVYKSRPSYEDLATKFAQLKKRHYKLEMIMIDIKGCMYDLDTFLEEEIK